MRLRVALDARPAAGELTGVGLAVVRLAEYLAQHDVECHLFYDGEPKSTVRGSNIHTTIIHNTRKGRGYWEQVLLPPALRRLQPHIYHATFNYGIPILSPCPGVLTVHDVIPLVLPDAFPEGLGGRLSWMKHWAQTWMATTQARSIMVDSHATAKDLARVMHTPASKHRVVPLGLDQPETSAVSHERIAACIARYGVQQPYLIYVGGMDHRKNLKGLLRAYSRLREQRPESPPLVIVGDKIAQYSELEAFTRQLGVDKSIAFPGYIPRQELWPILAGAEMLIYPSLYEGFGLPPLEAMACGTPVITSDTSSLPEVVGNAAILVNPRDETEIASSINRLLDDPSAREELRCRGRERAREFTWERYGEAVLNVYQQVIGET